MRRFLILSVLLTILSPTAVFAEFHSEVIEKAKSAIVAISALRGLNNSHGSGFFIDSNGHILTNYHVVEELKELWGYSYDGQEFELIVIYFWKNSDAAVLQAVKPMSNMPWRKEKIQNNFFIEFADPKSLSMGQAVFAIGHNRKLGWKWQVVEGTIKNIRELICCPNIYAVKYNPGIMPGFSGSPLLNREGRVVGMTTFSYPDSGYALIVERIRDFLVGLNQNLLKINLDLEVLLSSPKPSFQVLNDCVWIYTPEGKWCKIENTTK